MSIRNRGGKWHYRFQFDGKEYAASTGLAATVSNERRARQIEAEARKELQEGRQPQPKIKVTRFIDAAEDFLKWAVGEYRPHPNSYRRISTSMTSAKEFFGNKPVSMIHEAEIEQYKTMRITQHEVRDITLRHDLHALSVFFHYAIIQRWTTRNPIANTAIPSDKDATRMHILTPAEEAAYFVRAAKYPDLHDVGRLMILQGPRPEELTNLQKPDVDLERGELHIRRGKSEAESRTLHLTSEARSILARRLADEKNKTPWVFPSRKRRGQPAKRVNNAHDSVCADARKDGLSFDFVIYDFRHTWATRAAQRGIDLATLAAILGHSSIRIVQKYVHVQAEHQKAAMALYDQALQAEQKRQEQHSGRVN